MLCFLSVSLGCATDDSPQESLSIEESNRLWQMENLATWRETFRQIVSDLVLEQRAIGHKSNSARSKTSKGKSHGVSPRSDTLHDATWLQLEDEIARIQLAVPTQFPAQSAESSYNSRLDKPWEKLNDIWEGTVRKAEKANAGKVMLEKEMEVVGPKHKDEKVRLDRFLTLIIASSDAGT